MVAFGIFIVGFFLPRSVLAQIVINEVSPASSPEWVELYNTSDSPVSLSGCILYFDDNHNIQNTNLGDANIDSKSYFVHENSKSLLNNKGDELSLTCSWGEDKIAYGDQAGANLPAPKKTESIARVPDGSNFVITDAPTKGSMNPQPVVDVQEEVTVETEENNSVDGNVITPTTSQISYIETQNTKIVSQPSPPITKKQESVPEKREVLGVQQKEPTDVTAPSATAAPVTDQKQDRISLVAILLVLLGAICVGIAGYMIIRDVRNDKEISDTKQQD